MSQYSSETAYLTTEAMEGPILIGSNFHVAGVHEAVENFTASTHAKSFPSDVTLGFRHNFWRVFSELSEYEHGEVPFVWLGRKWHLVSLWVAESRDVEFTRGLDDPINIFLILVLRSEESSGRTLHDLFFDHDLNEQSAFGALVSALSAEPVYPFLKSFSHSRGLNGVFTWESPAVDVAPSVLVSIFAFHAYALLIIWKVAREQTNIVLSPSDEQFRKQLHSLLRIRSTLINLDRYLLTENISNHPAVKKLASSLRRRFGLRSKFDRLLPLNEVMQRHLEVVAQLRGDLKSTILNVIAFVIAAIGLPLSVIAAFLALNEVAPVVAQGLSYAWSPSIRSFLVAASLLSFGLLGLAAAFAVATIVLLRKRRR